MVRAVWMGTKCFSWSFLKVRDGSLFASGWTLPPYHHTLNLENRPFPSLVFPISRRTHYKQTKKRRWTACSRLEPTRELSLPIMYRRRYSMACLSDKNRHFRTHMVTITDSMASSFYFLQETQLSRISKTSVYHGNKTHVLQYNAKISV